jgi:hypothetical protein
MFPHIKAAGLTACAVLLGSVVVVGQGPKLSGHRMLNERRLSIPGKALPKAVLDVNCRSS